jgi:hypothetical protein
MEKSLYTKLRYFPLCEYLTNNFAWSYKLDTRNVEAIAIRHCSRYYLLIRSFSRPVFTVELRYLL